METAAPAPVPGPAHTPMAAPATEKATAATIATTVHNDASQAIPAPAQAPQYELSRWMASLPDTVALADVNIPGTHDSGAIAKGPARFCCVHLYSRQSRSITGQLSAGVRLLDVRIQVEKVEGKGKKEDAEPRYDFYLVHGAVLRKINLNRYDPLETLLQEVSDFLVSHPSEAVVASLKMDSWKGVDEHDAAEKRSALRALRALLNRYSAQFATLGADEPEAVQIAKVTLGTVRGKIVFFNRIDNLNDSAAHDSAAAAIPVVPFFYGDNTPGAQIPDSAIFVQDQYEGLDVDNPTRAKLELVNAAFDTKRDAAAPLVAWSFASVTRKKLLLVNVHYGLLKEIGNEEIDKRRRVLGWLLFDFAVQKKFVYSEQRKLRYPIDVVSLVVESNFDYVKHHDRFNVFSIFRKK